MNRRVVLQRFWEDYNQSTGSLYVVDVEDDNQPIFISACIERGDRCNEADVSNCPPGVYNLVWEYSDKFKMFLWELKGVPDGRSELKIHAANMWDQLNGCIAPGSHLGRLNRDGYYDVLASGTTLKRFHKALEPMQLLGTTITILDPI